MENFAYIMEEILFDNRKDRIESAIKDFVNLHKNGFNIDNDDSQEAVLFYNDLDILSEAEKQYIAREVRKEIF